VTLVFDSAVRSGTIQMTLDGVPLEPVRFSFGRKSTGRRVERTFPVAGGTHTIEVELETHKTGPSRVFSFVKRLGPGSTWTLRLDLPPGSKQVSAYLIESRSSS